MDNNVILPVNKEHFLRSSTTLAGLYSIISSSEYSGEKNAEVSKFVISTNDGHVDYFENNSSFYHNSKDIRLDLDALNHRLTFYSHPYTENKYAYISKKISVKENPNVKLVIKIDCLQISNLQSSIKIIFSNGISVTNENLKELSFADECSLRVCANGFLIFQAPSGRDVIKIGGPDKPTSMFLSLELDSFIRAQYSFDGVVWELLHESKWNDSNFTEVGLYLCPKINPFFYEFYISYIQLCFSPATKTLKQHPEMEERFFANMLKVYHIPSEAIEFLDENIVEYFMDLISKKYYMRLRLNEFYVPGTLCYKRVDCDHVNFIYGFDRSRKVFQLISFNQYLQFTEIGFDDFISAIKYKKQVSDKITLYKYVASKKPAHFSTSAAISSLKAYVDGHPSYRVTSMKTIVMDKEWQAIYGINIYKEMLTNKEDMDCLINDVRIPLKIKEHFVIVIKMLEFLSHIQLISNSEYKEHLEAFQDLSNHCEAIRILILKNRTKPVADIELLISDMLKKLIDKDEIATKNLIRSLESVNASNR